MSSSTRWAVPLVVSLLALGTVPADMLGSAQAAPRVPVRDDFNGDGYADLAVGAPGATVGGQSGAGYVAVTYGGPHGLSNNRRVVISRATGGIPGSPVKDQGFGTQISKGDLNGDGYADLVVGVATRTGDAVVVWGGPRGLSGGGVSIPASRTVTGDFDGDGRLDLALFRTGDSPGDDLLGTTATVWTGPVGRSGTPARTSALDPDHLQYVDVKDGTTGDVDGDGRDELALAVYCGDGNYCTDFYAGSASGLKYRRDAVPDGDGGVALGDLNGDGHDDVAVGSATDSTVTVAYGSASGVRPRSTWKSYSQDVPGVPGAKEINDRFGTALSAGDITGDGIDDLAVGVPGKELGSDDRAGSVVVLRGSRAGLTGRGAQAFTQDTVGVPGTAEPGDAFGARVALLDINGNGYADLATAATGEDGGNGAVWVLRGRPTGIVTDAATVVGPMAIGAPYAKAAFGKELG
ncbi:FG-GAP-like repeat-containing protein [Streptomyces sp. NPDC048751]|uniref:FG-GAP-like repeat-containing protein n=1 Tax=Streptomyces sp. NPDC048751 TaxID=3365591 RepID=UPI003718D0F1